jgi:hypothetical protein
MVGGDGDVLGMALPSVGPPQHLVTDGEPIDPLADLVDHTGQVTALTRGEGGREPGVEEALTDGGLSGIGAGSLDRNQDLTGRRIGHVDLGDVQDIQPAVLVESDCSTPSGHRWPLSPGIAAPPDASHTFTTRHPINLCPVVEHVATEVSQARSVRAGWPTRPVSTHHRARRE